MVRKVRGWGVDMEVEETSAGQRLDGEQLELERRRLECEKLRAEIVQVSLPWWKRAGYIGSMLPIVISVVGFSSAWMTGYFDTERGLLKSQIESLGRKRDELMKANEETQRQIDNAYLRLKLGSAEAEYALGHIRGFPPLTEGAKANLEAATTTLPPEQANAFRQILERQVPRAGHHDGDTRWQRAYGNDGKGSDTAVPHPS